MKARIYTSIIAPFDGVITEFRSIRKVKAPSIAAIRKIALEIEGYEGKTVEQIVIL